MKRKKYDTIEMFVKEIIMFEVVLGNTCCLLAMLFDSYSSSKKTKKDILFYQSISQFIWGMSSIFLKGYSASVQNFMTIVRNFFALKEEPPKWIQWGIILASVVLGIVFNNRGFMGWLPIIANLEYSICVFTIKDNEKLLKISFLISVILFVIFNIYIVSIVGTIANFFIIGSYVISIVKHDQPQENKKQ